MTNGAVDTFNAALAASGRQALLDRLAALCGAIDAAESSILRPASEAELGFFVSTNPGLIAATVPKIPIGGSFAGVVFRTGQMLAVADAVRQPGHFGGIDTVVGRATREYAALPIASTATPLGVLTVVNRTSPGGGSRPFTVDELKTAQQTAMELAGPLAILDSLDSGLSPSHRDSVREAFGDEFIRDLLALDETGRRVVQCLVSALPYSFRKDPS